MPDTQQTKKCRICQKPLKTGKIYCSLKCYHQKSPKEKIKCRQCGKYFYSYKCWQKKKQGFLCSKQCKYKWGSEQYRGDKSKAGWRGGKIKKICKWCKKEFFKHLSHTNTIEKPAKYCSRKCFDNWYRKNCRGEKARRWIDGSSFLPYGPGFTKTMKKKIKERDNYTCQKCGSKKKLSIHHIDYDKKNNKEKNLITLCISCNVKDIRINHPKFKHDTTKPKTSN